MQLKLSKRYHTLGKPIKKAKPSYKQYQIYIEFDNYQRDNYSIIPTNCLCGNNNSYLISTVDREGWEYKLVLCESCGLIRAKEYWDEKSVRDFYKNWYRKKYGTEKDPDKFYNKQKISSKIVWDFVFQYTSKFSIPMTVVDIGGGAGGRLDCFKAHNCYLFDFNKTFLEKANMMGIKTQEGGTDKLHLIDKKPDLVILSHVLEHFTNVDRELKTLIKYLEIGSLVYIEIPGIDSLKGGRRSYDFLGDIHWPHVFYFSRDVINNLMERYGFRCLKSNTLVSGLYEYTGQTVELKNYHDVVCSLIKSAEIKRKLGFRFLLQIKFFIAGILPCSLKNMIKKYL